MLTLKLTVCPETEALWRSQVLFTPLYVHLAHSLESIGAQVVYGGADEEMRSVLAPSLTDAAGDDVFELAEPVFFTPETLKETLESGTLTSNAVPYRDFTRLAEAEEELRREVIARLLASGVRIVGPATVFIAPTVTVEPGATVLPGCILRGRTTIRSGAVIGPNSIVENSEIASGVTVNASQVYDSRIGEGTTVGPFAHVRPNCVIGERCRVGAFVEFKNSNIGDGTKASHLTFVGDSDVGSRVNFGCGTVTCNYDGYKKHRTTIEDDAFIGCNTNLVAPVAVRAGAFTAAGTTVTDEVPADALAIGRAYTVNKADWVKRYRAKHEGK